MSPVFCPLCGVKLRPVQNRQSKDCSDVMACEHCDNACAHPRRCVQARMWEPLAAVEVDGPELDPHALWREDVGDFAHYYDDGEDWSQRGYL